MGKRTVKVVLDTNILISSLVFGGKPSEILEMIRGKEIKGVISPVLLAELGDVLAKKFGYPKSRVLQVQEKLKQYFKIVHPARIVEVVRDDDDNRVLEVAVEGGSKYVVTGDKDLLDLKKYGGIKILTPTKFLEAWRG